MPSQDKLIKQGILLTDTTFDEIIKRLQNGVKTSDTLESFLTKHKEVIVDNPLVAIGYKDKLTEIILQETNNHKFSRPAQKELTRLTIENRVGDLITNVGDDIKQDVRDIVSDGYNNNLSQNEIANNISNSISKIKNTRARVIARTEIARTATASDYVINRERGATHFKVDCRKSCCPVCAKKYNWGKNEFSIDDVGMLPPLHPNCRCYAMFFIKDGNERNVLTKKPQTTTTKTTQIPSREQLNKNLTQKERKEYNDIKYEIKWATDILNKSSSTDKQKDYAKKRLDTINPRLKELTDKALGKPVETKQPKAEPKPKTTTKPKETTTKTSTAESMTSNELYESMTKADKKKYDKAKEKLATVEKNIKTIGESDLLLRMKKDRLLEIQQLEQKQRDKLANKGKRKPKQKTVRTHERTLDTIHKDVEVPTKKLIPTLEKWIDKRCKNTAEFGFNFNTKTGEIIGDEVRGVKGRVSLTDLGKGTGTIHSHPRNGMSVPSVGDLESFRCEKGEHHFMVSEHEIWYVKATDSFGSMAMGQQLDLQKAHKECRDRAFEQVSKEIKKGKIDATEEAIAKKLDEYTGNEILKTFNKPPWNKTLTVKRYYR